MVHGAVLAGHGDALANGLHELAPHDWAQEVWSLAAMGLQLQELYVSAKLMSPWAWDELAAALQWARENWEVLQDAHWAVAAGCRKGPVGKAFRPYVMAAYKEKASEGSTRGTGFLLLRNPRNRTQTVPRFTLADALELPAASAAAAFAVEVVRRSSWENPAGGAIPCEDLAKTAQELGDGRCSFGAGAPVKLKMQAGELAVLRAELRAG
mmetsp:Transcript_47852/g.145338  ORF Transcript_47852/g.145338 Transcript_47852/m.145338 type:complete len:210 (-) Transcript_47852:32-661(-)